MRAVSAVKRTHGAGEAARLVSEEVQMGGWLESVRVVKKGGGGDGLVFGVLRDHTGRVQLQAVGATALLLASLPLESALTVRGRIVARPTAALNPRMPTGAVELAVDHLPFVNPCRLPLPFPVDQPGVAEDVRLRHRFLDLRSSRMQRNLRLRAEMTHSIRCWLRHLRFLEVETPYLFRPTPEGAKEFLVRTRWPSLWYSLPQSPQQYKQLLMVGGADRYFQIARCFRDEDMRTERQPEFTQVDFEMAFADEVDVMSVAEKVIQAACDAVLGPQSEPIVFKHMTYDEAMSLYGSDKPDLRIQSRIEQPDESGWNAEGKVLRILRLASKPDPDALKGALASNPELVAFVDGKWLGKWENVLSPKGKAAIEAQASAKSTDVLSSLSSSPSSAASAARRRVTLFAAGSDATSVCVLLGRLRLQLDTIPENRRGDREWLWVTEFPMFEVTADGVKAAHHPFTAPMDAELFAGPHALQCKARAYDIVMNGVELGGGSVRIADVATQLRALALVGVDEEKARSTLGHLLDALALGAPPHAGLAFGLDRLVMQLLGESSLKDVIAFPKAADGKELMVGSPSRIEELQ